MPALRATAYQSAAYGSSVLRICTEAEKLSGLA
jgi:hypothetical protein